MKRGQKSLLGGISLFVLLFAVNSWSVNISVDVHANQKLVNPHIYGRNNSIRLASWNATTETEKELFRQVGLRFSRESGGNNSSKYNWRKKLSSHPDWYNNVYTHDWDSIAGVIQNQLPEVDGLFAIPTTGWAAASDSCNYDEGANDPTNAHTTENLACGGVANKYLEPWPGDSAAGILDHWFGTSGIGLDSSRFLIWNLDNEPEIWNSTHDDVFTTAPTAEEIVQKYLEAARAAKRMHPGIKLAGPVFTNEWQWWKGADGTDGLSWMEFFIKRFAEESQKDGVQLIDYIDFHFYPDYDGSATGASGDETVLQMHRIWYDRDYDYPQANGSKTYPSGWNENQKKEFVFSRVQDWVTQYFGAGTDIGVGISECGFFGGTPSVNVTAVWYASQLGTFAENGTSYFTPWSWYDGMYEVMHLFSRYGGKWSVQSSSDLDSLVSAYSFLHESKDSVTVILVNRSQSASQSVQIELSNFEAAGTSATSLQLSNLSGETFISHTNNALKTASVSLQSAGGNSSFSMNLPALSVTAVVIASSSEVTVGSLLSKTSEQNISYANGKLFLPSQVVAGRELVQIFNLQGKLLWKDVANKSIVKLPKSIFGQVLVKTKSSSLGMMIPPQ